MNDSSAPILTELPGRTPLPPVAFDLGSLGYGEAELVLEGMARSFALDGPKTEDGRWVANDAATAAYTTRLIVRRPVDAASFSGTVLVEWLNVSGGMDLAPEWAMVHREILRAGHAWVGVSVQRAGIEGGGLFESFHLKKAFPDRYAALVHPGDAWAFDIFSQAGALVRSPAADELLPGLRPAQVLGVGESQSAIFLSAYVNAVDPIAPVYDGFLVHSRGAAAADLDGLPQGLETTELADAMWAVTTADRIRDDVRVPVIVLQAETDVVVMGSARCEQPDGPNTRVWEMAGASHGDLYMFRAADIDDGTRSAADLARAMHPTRDLPWGATAVAVNAGPQHHYIAQAALRSLVEWAAGGPAPPEADRLSRTSDPRRFDLDDHGVALGGVRSPWVDVPVAVLSGLGQPGGDLSVLFGSTTLFDAHTLQTLYPGGRDDYLARFTRSLDETIDAGFILGDDRDEIAAVAAEAWDLLHTPAGTS